MNDGVLVHSRTPLKLLLAIFLTTLPVVVSRADDAVITVDPHHVLGLLSPYMTGSCIEDVNHEVYGGIYSQMVFGESFQEPLQYDPKSNPLGFTKYWRIILQHGSTPGAITSRYSLSKDDPFVGSLSAHIETSSGSGVQGIVNAGLGRTGMNFIAGREYDGELAVRAKKPTDVLVEAVGLGGQKVYAKDTLHASSADWKVLSFRFTSTTSDSHGGFAILLPSPGSIDIGYAFLQSGSWGRFHNLPVRRDVAEKLVEQGVTVMRYGGSMINDPSYRWKNMIGPRAKRPPTHGTWYPYSSNGWGIPDFCAFCDAAGFLGIPAFNMGEAPQDMADFVEYAHGGPQTKWGAQRIADGNKSPFKVHVIELGNEEQVNGPYWQKFEPIARAIWSRDPRMILTVGDFHYDNVITDPFHFAGGAVDTLAAHQKILALAKEYGAEVWFDVHLGTQDVPASNALDPLLSYIHALQGLGNGAKFHVVTYELNANTHDLTRALANAKMIGMIERAGAEPVVTSANALQVDGQNDNGWDQGLLFMTPDKVWLQPPGYVTQMMSRNRLANVVQANCTDPNLDVTATASADGKSIALQVVNSGDTPKSVRIKFAGREILILLKISELTGALNAVNTAAALETIKPSEHLVEHGVLFDNNYTFAPHSFTVLSFRGGGVH
jgi:hypothetical protein